MKKMEFNQEFTSDILSMTKLASKNSQIIFAAEGGLLTVVTDGGEVCVRRRFEINPSAQFKFSMKMNELEALFSAFAYGIIKVEDGRLTLTSAKTRLVRSTIPPAEIFDPAFPETADNETEITADVFELAGCVAYATAKTDSRPTAERVAFSVKNNCLRAYAMDGCRFATVGASCKTIGDGQEYMLRPSLITALNALIKKEKLEKISIGSTSLKYLIKLGEFEISVSRLMSESQYAIIEAILKQSDANKTTSVTFSRGEMLRYLQRINLVVDKNVSQAIVTCLDPQEKSANASYKSAAGCIDDVFDAVYDGVSAALTFAVKPEYLFDACQKIQDSVLSMQLISPTAPIILRETCDDMEFIHGISPVRVNAEKPSGEQHVVDKEPASKVPTRLKKPVSMMDDAEVDDTALAS